MLADILQNVSAGKVPAPPLIALPFAMLLLAIAFAPFINHHWWERHYYAVSIALGAVTASYYVFWHGDFARLGHVIHEYVGFMALIGALYVVSGGIRVQIGGRATPMRNASLLLAGALLSNIIGTTGASMLLIGPLIRFNGRRIATYHVIFFIFLVSNIGGCLTPIGDPPLFIGYLKGAPFWWVFEHCWKPWLFGVGATLAIFYVVDRVHFRPTAAEEPAERWGIDGLPNLAFLAIAVGAVFVEKPIGLREILMTAAAAASYRTTPAAVHKANDFSFGPLKEVAWLFIGIFMTMAPLLDYLGVNAEALGIRSQTQFFWLTGSLSGVLDNAPTYVTFLATALGNHGMSIDLPNDVRTFMIRQSGHALAISLGAVFFGAMTYIGNGPNFMVKAVAQSSGIRMPNFFAYILKYSAPILGPIFAAVWLLFFSRWRVF